MQRVSTMDKKETVLVSFSAVPHNRHRYRFDFCTRYSTNSFLLKNQMRSVFTIYVYNFRRCCATHTFLQRLFLRNMKRFVSSNRILFQRLASCSKPQVKGLILCVDPVVVCYKIGSEPKRLGVRLQIVMLQVRILSLSL